MGEKICKEKILLLYRKLGIICEERIESFAGMVSRSAESYLDSLKENQELFDNLYHCYVEMRLFFSKDKEKLKPLENLLLAKNRIKGLL